MLRGRLCRLRWLRLLLVYWGLCRCWLHLRLGSGRECLQLRLRLRLLLLLPHLLLSPLRGGRLHRLRRLLVLLLRLWLGLTPLRRGLRLLVSLLHGDGGRCLYGRLRRWRVGGRLPRVEERGIHRLLRHLLVLLQKLGGSSRAVLELEVDEGVARLLRGHHTGKALLRGRQTLFER